MNTYTVDTVEIFSPVLMITLVLIMNVITIICKPVILGHTLTISFM